MSYRIAFTVQAETQLDVAKNWWAQHRSSEQAGRWFVGFSDALLSLANQPQRWPLAKEDAHFSYEIRELHFGLGKRPTHRSVFTILPDVVVILAIRHAAQDDITPEDV